LIRRFRSAPSSAIVSRPLCSRSPRAEARFQGVRRFSAGPSVFAALARVASPERITFGTDFSMAPITATTAFDSDLEQFEPGLRSAAYRHNGKRVGFAHGQPVIGVAAIEAAQLLPLKAGASIHHFRPLGNPKREDAVYPTICPTAKTDADDPWYSSSSVSCMVELCLSGFMSRLSTSP
jgi:hypothetical protein